MTVEALHITNFPTGLKEELKKMAESEQRSLTGQIIYILQKYVDLHG